MQRRGKLSGLDRVFQGRLLCMPDPDQRNRDQQMDLREYICLAVPAWQRLATAGHVAARTAVAGRGRYPLRA